MIGSSVELECLTAAHPQSLNYWSRDGVSYIVPRYVRSNKRHVPTMEILSMYMYVRTYVGKMIQIRLSLFSGTTNTFWARRREILRITTFRWSWGLSMWRRWTSGSTSAWPRIPRVTATRTSRCTVSEGEFIRVSQSTYDWLHVFTANWHCKVNNSLQRAP